MLTRNRCAVWGSPVGHSLSPVLHRAAYAALGLDGWTYDRREVDRDGFAEALADLGPQWRGLSLTMPLKEVALGAATRASATATRVGAANTLVREGAGWVADNTDVHGLRVALVEAGCRTPRSGLVVGSGATARSAILALAGLGVAEVALMVRDRPRRQTLELAERLGLAVRAVEMGDWRPVDVVVGTAPRVATAAFAPRVPPAPPGGVLLDVVYGEGPSPLVAAARERGWSVAEGTEMLLHQAAAQVRLMTGREAPVAAMRAALAAALRAAGR